ncbi:molybdopterin synthase sulfur carrier subunit [Inhella inkyongensis]|uniref:Molybdopterin synthase sulfur carrier subunit n=1 Tax=Inhella inkyongensis TaxID=392593 RepID=A0A840RZZ7_9BURK|nr:MoaD/ThiS family protein [Inhella inkyongensis]MBB5203575.1 molybdopterin synthase sulfur carrier subunit [Inhella inkyongensis]
MLTLRFFARLREALGPQESWPFEEGLTVGRLRDALIARGGAHAEVLGRQALLRCARNQQMCAEDTPLADGDEVAFFPPVTGG